MKPTTARLLADPHDAQARAAACRMRVYELERLAFTEAANTAGSRLERRPVRVRALLKHLLHSVTRMEMDGLAEKPPG